MARQQSPGPPDDRAVFVISVAAELVGVHPQTLRIYERKGLVRPKRSASSNSRRYSARDIERLREIQELTGATWCPTPRPSCCTSPNRARGRGGPEMSNQP